MASRGSASDDDGPSSNPWHLIHHSESASIGGVEPPSPSGLPVADSTEDFYDHLDGLSFDEGAIGDEFLADEHAWYNNVRDEEHDPRDPSGSLAGDSERAGRPCSGTNFAVQGPPLEDSAFVRLAAGTSFKRLRLERPRQAWESHPVFGGASCGPLHRWAGAALIPAVGVRETINHPEPAENFGGEEASHVPWTIERRLKGVRVQRTDEDERNHALKKLKAVVLLDPMATALGKSLVQQTGALETEEVISSSFCDAFSSKAAGTLTKRAGSLQRLVVQLYKQEVASPWRMEEAQLYAALTTLRDGGCGATSLSHILESLHFLNSIVRFLHMDLEEVISARCKGVAHSCFVSKAPLEQRDPLTCGQVRRLEEAMVRAGPVGQCILGQILFCIHAVCRWKDSQKLKGLELLGHGEGQILFGDALGSKTAVSQESKSRFTPYAALAQGLTECSWGRLWMDARRQCKLSFGQGPGGYCLPTRSQRTDEWGKTPMGAGEASSYLAEILEGTEEEGQRIGTHSLKVTLLTWASRSTVVRLSKNERLLLGHHIAPGVKSMVTYSREGDTSLIGKVLALYRSIRSGIFNPDLQPAARVLQVADSLTAGGDVTAAGPEVPDEVVVEPMGGSDNESGGTATGDEDAAPFDLPGLPAVRVPFAEVELSQCRIHSVSGIAHCLRDTDFFYCGRMCTARYSRYSGVGTEDPDVCLQCTRAMNE